MLEVHPRLVGDAVPSTRFRDLADLAIFAHTAEVDATHFRNALVAEATRGLELPKGLPQREGPGWVAGYARVARGVARLDEKDLDSALETVRRMVDPALSSTASGSWCSETLAWSG